MRSLRVLYVTDRFDGPYRYRCQQACEQLRAEGAVANVAHLEDARLLPELPRYGAVVLFRLPWSERVEAIVTVARRAGLPLLFDIDDLTFDPSLDELMPFRSRYESEEWTRAYGRHMIGLRRTLDAADAFIGSTPELAEHAILLGKKSHVHRNVVPEAYLRSGLWTERIRRTLRTRPTIGYFSGSDTHDEDFASIAPALARVLARSPRARLLIVGYLDLGGGIPDVERRVVRLPYMHWRQFALAYAACHVTLAPLATRNAFTNGKSALKFFEAGAFFTPTVATPVREMEAAILHGETGFLATTEDEWAAAMEGALSEETSARIGSAARLAVLREHSMAARRGALRAILEQYAVVPAGPPPDPSPLDPPDETGRARSLGRILRPGRATRDLARVFRAARRAPGPDIDSAKLERLLNALRANAPAEGPVESGGYVLLAAGPSAFRTNADVGPDGALPGENRSKGEDPQLILGNLDLDPKRHRYLLIRLRVSSGSRSVRTQIFWKDGEEAPFLERSSVALSVATDGFDRTYLVDLHDDATRAAWHRARRVANLRVDPMDRPGSFRIDSIALLPESFSSDEATLTEPKPNPSLEIDATDRAGPSRMETAFAALPGGAQLTVRVSGLPAAARRSAGEWASRLDAIVTRLFIDADGTATAVLEKRRPVRARGVDIVVPVWNAKDLVLRCLASVVAHAGGNYRLVVIDDASTDPEMAPALEAFEKEHERVVILTNPKNLGFVGTANRGLVHASDRDVLLLNSDTEVFAEFLDRLQAAAYSDKSVGMVSPLSNNATICSVPDFCVDNTHTLPEGVTAEDMAVLVRHSSEQQRPELVTPHGFCLYLRRDCLDVLGLLDEERFGRGFGEENDLGERAKKAGYLILLADDVYVWHAGKASFTDEGHALEKRHAEILEKRHPGYHAAVATFVRDNPLAPVHRGLRRHLARRSHLAQPAPLFILHASPFSAQRGGVEHCVRDLVEKTALPRAVLVYPAGGALEVAEIFDGDADHPERYRFPLDRPPERFCHDNRDALSAMDEILSLYRVGWAHVHHLMFLPLTIGRLLREREIPYVVTVHDFYVACPSFNLLDLRTTTRCCPESCGDASRTAACQRALFESLGERVPADPVLFVDHHRRLFTEILNGSVRTLFPSPSTRQITSTMLPLEAERTAIVPHGYGVSLSASALHPAKDLLRVAIVGAIAYATKGAAAYLSVMALTAGAPVEWHVFGPTDLFGFERKLTALEPRVRVVRHGAYARGDIVRLITSAGIGLAVILPPWPETFSYTLSEIEAAGVPVIAARVGALADRLEGAPHAVLVDNREEAARAVVRLASDRDLLQRMARATPTPPGTEAWAEEHRSLYSECAALSPVKGPRALTDLEYRRLNELAVAPPVAAHQGATVTRPAPHHTSAWWYPFAERAKSYAPESLRHIVRHRLARDGARPIVRFRLPGKRARLGQQLTLERRYVGTAQLTSHGKDPQIFLDSPPFDPGKVQIVRFNMWCKTASTARAKLYFKHAGARDFDERHCITFLIDGRTGTWQEYVVYLDASDRAEAWYDGGPIVALRFDPIDEKGPIGLGELALCEVRGT
jgi:glycosyltransferase involved in cell wall biosynthesis/GT2 family glycosyltransferase